MPWAGQKLCLLDILSELPAACMVGLLQDGPFRERLEAHQIPVQVLSQAGIKTRKESSLLQGMAGFVQLLPIIRRTTRLAPGLRLKSTPTRPKPLILGACASVLTGLPLVPTHLHDIISADHFSATNRKLLILLANRCCRQVIANSEATKAAFYRRRGEMRPKSASFYNGFSAWGLSGGRRGVRDRIRQELDLDHRFVVGHFSRLSPWKGQHVLIEALTHCPENVCALLIGDALFGEDYYVQELHRQVESLQLQHRVKFFRLSHRCTRDDGPPAIWLPILPRPPNPFGRVRSGSYVVPTTCCCRCRWRGSRTGKPP